ncbi:MAG: ATP synthase F0 subunit C [Bradymonadales bacterium]|jgi:F-type H+-transporting ATPase subunit c
MSIPKKIALFAISTFTLLCCFVPFAFAQEALEAAAQGDIHPARYIAAAFAIGIAALGGSIGQGRAAAGALEGIARNPGAYNKIFMPMIIGLALIESLVIYGLLIALLSIFA